MYVCIGSMYDGTIEVDKGMVRLAFSGRWSLSKASKSVEI